MERNHVEVMIIVWQLGSGLKTLTPREHNDIVVLWYPHSMKAATCHRACIDIAWDPTGVDVDRLLEIEPVFGDFTDRRVAQKARFGCEFFPSSFTADSVGNTFVEFFQIDKETEAQKGIVALDLQR